MNATRAMLLESRNTMKSVHKVDLTSMTDFKNMVVSDDQFGTYKASLMESVSAGHKDALDLMVNNSRMRLLESINSTYQLTPYETLSLPILFAFYPRLITKELVTVRNINAPDMLMPFMKYDFVRPDGSVIGQAPHYGNVSYGPSVTVASAKAVTMGAFDVLADNLYNLFYSLNRHHLYDQR